MRDQYAGDVSDYLKFAFLRALALSDRRLGVAWYYAPGDDGRPDGRHTEWQQDAGWLGLDKALHAGLRALPVRSVAALEEASIWPQGTLFHREPVPPRASRSSWAAQKRAALTGADIVFLDPDNGLGKETPKHAAWPELHALRHPGRALVFITFPGRTKPHAVLLRELHARLLGETGATGVATLCTNASVPRAEGSTSLVPRQSWFTLVDPDEILLARALTFSEAMSALPRATASLVLQQPQDAYACQIGRPSGRFSPKQKTEQLEDAGRTGGCALSTRDCWCQSGGFRVASRTLISLAA